jgi:acetaldehyde dehydrogenase
MKVAILGTGNVGTDLLIKVMRSKHLECTAFLGRNFDSPGMAVGAKTGVVCSDRGIDYIKDNPKCCKMVFDCTSAESHLIHNEVLSKLGIRVIDLTPSKIGKSCIPAINMLECLNYNNLSLITCGGQAAIPIAWAISKTQLKVEYIEVVSSISSYSAGLATRANLDEYIHATESAIKLFTGVTRSKAILNLNPAQPPIDMQTTIYAKVQMANLNTLNNCLKFLEKEMEVYVQGYQIILWPILENGRICVTIKVTGRGDYLPTYAGNLDIINCAAIALAEEIEKGGV